MKIRILKHGTGLSSAHYGKVYDAEEIQPGVYRIQVWKKGSQPVIDRHMIAGKSAEIVPDTPITFF